MVVEARRKGVLELKAGRRSAMHGTNVDDVGKACVIIADLERKLVKEQVYEILPWWYETLGEVAEASVRERDGWRSRATRKVVWGVWLGFGSGLGVQTLGKIQTGWTGRSPLLSEEVGFYKKKSI